jgi:5'-nucleotidase/UDP-sugar diphosphatase
MSRRGGEECLHQGDTETQRDLPDEHLRRDTPTDGSVLPGLRSSVSSVSPWLNVVRSLAVPAAAAVLPAAGLVLLVTALASPASAAPAAPLQLQSTLHGERARAGESEAGNLIADALRAATGADIALVAAGELREESLAPGAVTLEQLRRLLVNGDEPVTVLSLSGATLRGALEVAVGLYPRKHKGFLQVSGLEFSFDPSRAEGSRIVARTQGGQPMQDGRQYRVAMSSSLASGQYGYYRLWSRERGTAAQGLTMAGALEQYLRDRRTLAPRLESRIKVAGSRQ